jgi:hypothetical protein
MAVEMETEIAGGRIAVADKMKKPSFFRFFGGRALVKVTKDNTMWPWKEDPYD